MISKLEDFDYTMEQSEEGYKNFTVIKCKIKSIEWLYLAAKGHRRAKFDLENNKECLVSSLNNFFKLVYYSKHLYFGKKHSPKAIMSFCNEDFYLSSH